MSELTRTEKVFYYQLYCLLVGRQTVCRGHEITLDELAKMAVQLHGRYWGEDPSEAYEKLNRLVHGDVDEWEAFWGANPSGCAILLDVSPLH